jgi:uncharacterized membrane protein
VAGFKIKISPLDKNAMNTTISKIGRVLIWLILVVTLILGIGFRFSNLERKVYWFDETFTSLRTAGFKNEDVNQLFANGRQVTVSQLQRYQLLNPERGALDTIWSLAEDVHPPLYFLMLRGWLSFWGDSIANTRSLSAFISILSLPAIYWLCKELFAEIPLSTQIGWMTMALIAVSPFQLIFAQEARPYSFWFLTIALSTASLLYVLRKSDRIAKSKRYDRVDNNNLSNRNSSWDSNWQVWLVYGVSIVIGLYSHFLFSLVLFSHLIFLLFLENFRWKSSQFRPFWLAIILGFTCFLPWIVLCSLNLHRFLGQLKWVVTAKPGFFELIGSWIYGLGLLFINTGSRRELFPPHWVKSSALDSLILAILLVLVGWAIYRLYRKGSYHSYLMIVVMMLTSILPFLLARNSVERFAMPFWLMVYILIAYLIISLIYSHQAWQNVLGVALTIALFSIGLFSCWTIAQANTWWHKGMNYYDYQLAAAIARSAHPLVLSDGERPGTQIALISLAHSLKPSVTVQAIPSPYDIPIESDAFSDIFLYRAAREPLKNKLSMTYKLVTVHEEGELWHLVPIREN